ncbi:AAA family ATPase [Mycobacterium sp. URHB0021]
MSPPEDEGRPGPVQVEPSPESSAITTDNTKSNAGGDPGGNGEMPASADADTVRAYLHATLGDAVGYLITATGTGVHLGPNGKPRHSSWRERPYTWPAQADKAVNAILAAAPHSDVYVCPYVMKDRTRAKGTAVTHTLVHADIDRGTADSEGTSSEALDDVAQLHVLVHQVQMRSDFDGFAVASGTPGHAHVYVPLAAPVTAAQHEALCRALTKRLGGDPGKISDNDLLRPPGTFNHKRAAFGGKPTPVLSVEGIFPDNRVDPRALADALGVDLGAVTNGKAGTAAVPTRCESVDLTAHPDVQAALDNVTGDRSGDTYRVVAACKDDGLTLEQTRYVVASRADLAGRLDERNDDDVLTCWLKVIDDQQQQVQIIGGSVGGDDDDQQATPPEPPLYTSRILTRAALRELPDPEPLIDNVLDQGTIVLLYGKWGTAKTFIALDWGLSVLTGRKWQARAVEQRRVLYVAAEGAFGFKGRVDAWERGWHATIGDGDFALLPHPVNLTRAVDVANLGALISWGGYDYVILDTLARCMVGADENSAKDCGVAVDNMVRLLGCTPGGRGVVQGVHHAGKDGKTMRGSSAFEGAADTVYFASRDGAVITLDREKRKDGPELDHHQFVIVPIVGTNSAVIYPWPEASAVTRRREFFATRQRESPPTWAALPKFPYGCRTSTFPVGEVHTIEPSASW